MNDSQFKQKIKFILKKLSIFLLILFSIFLVLLFIVVTFILINSKESILSDTSWLLFVIILSSIYVIHLFVFPFLFILKFIDVLYISVLLSIALFYIAYLVTKKYFTMTKYSLFRILLGVILLFNLFAYVEARMYISNAAQTTFHAKPSKIFINVSILTYYWLDFDPCPLWVAGPVGYSPHRVFVNGEWHTWSFREKKFDY